MSFAQSTLSNHINSKSGLGDHGPKGIKDAIDNHRCNIFCKVLELSSADVLHNSLELRIQEHDTRAIAATGEAPVTLVDHGSESDSDD